MTLSGISSTIGISAPGWPRRDFQALHRVVLPLCVSMSLLEFSDPRRVVFEEDFDRIA